MKSLTCENVHQLLSDLIAGGIAPDESDGVQAHLVGCDSCSAHVEALFWQDRALAELAAVNDLDRLTARIHVALAGEPVPGVSAPSRPQPRRRLPRVALRVSLAASLLFVAVLFLWLSAKGPGAASAFARLEQVQGEVYVLAADTRIPAQAGQELFAGQGLEVGEGRAVVAYPDATRLELHDETLVRWSPDEKGAPGSAGKSVFLTQGVVIADVAEQSESSPMVVTTPQAEVAARGNRFSLIHAADSTHLELEKGAVQVTRRSDGKSIQASPGAYLVTTSAKGDMVPQPLPPRFDRARAVLDGFTSGIWSLAFAPESNTLAAGTSDGVAQVWDIDRVERTALLQGHGKTVRCLTFASDGQTLATAGDDRTVLLWDLARQQKTALQGPSTVTFALHFSPAGLTLTTATYDRTVRTFDVAAARGRAILRLQKQAGAGDFLACMAFSPDGGLLAWGVKDHTIRLWDAVTGHERHTLRGHEDAVVAVAFSPDGSTLATGSRDRTVKLWDVDTGRLRATLRGHRHTVNALAFAPDGRTLASGSSDTTVKLWDMDTFEEQAVLRGHSKGVLAVAFAPDGRTLATAGLDATVRLWDLPLGGER